MTSSELSGRFDVAIRTQSCRSPLSRLRFKILRTLRARPALASAAFRLPEGLPDLLGGTGESGVFDSADMASPAPKQTPPPQLTPIGASCEGRSSAPPPQIAQIVMDGR